MMETDQLAVYADPEDEASPSGPATVARAAGGEEADPIFEQCNYQDVQLRRRG